jgi:CRP-like cAMP-binding protein
MIPIMTEELATLIAALPGRDVRHRAGATVFRIGNPVRCIHVVRAGRIHLARHQADGSRLILQRAGAGAVVAEASLHSARYHCDAVAEVDSVTWAVPRGLLQEGLKENPALAEAWMQHLAREVQGARLHAEILALKTVAARLDAWLAWHGALPDKGYWATMAQQIGVSPEALYRELAKRRAAPAGARRP